MTAGMEAQKFAVAKGAAAGVQLLLMCRASEPMLCALRVYLFIV